MLYLRTGLPGASKTLNTLKEICEDRALIGRPRFYNNIKLLLLDYDVCSSFSGFFYGFYLPQVDKTERLKLQKIITRVHSEGDLITLDNLPHLRVYFDPWLESGGAFRLWSSWVFRVYPSNITQQLRDYLDLTDSPSFVDIEHLNLHFSFFDDPLLWYMLPHGSVIVIDECQQWFPPRPVGSKVPLHCSEFETHRHKGFDIHLVTQDAKLLDSHVRRLTNRHIHFHNPLASRAVSRLLSDKVFDPSSWHERQNTTSSLIKRDVKFYGLYWSADLHTHKMYLPKKLVFLVVAIVLVPSLLVFFVLTRFSSSDSNFKNSQFEVGDVTSLSSSSSFNSSLEPYFSHAGFIHLPASALSSMQHPLSDHCDDFTLSVHETVKNKSGIRRSYYFQCDSFNNSQSNDDAIPVVELFSEQHLARLGYKIYAEPGLVALTYKNLKFFFSDF